MEPGKGAACCWGYGLLSSETLPLLASVSPSVRHWSGSKCGSVWVGFWSQDSENLGISMPTCPVRTGHRAVGGVVLSECQAGTPKQVRGNP